MIHAPHNNEIKLISVKESPIKTIKQVIQSIRQSILFDTQIKFCETINTKKLISSIKSSFECTVREGVTGGCYGARDGSTQKGITLWVSASEYPGRWVNRDGTEMVNYWALLNEYGTFRGQDEYGAAERMASLFGLEFESDNSYNYEGSGQRPQGLSTINFNYLRREGGGIISFVEFHFGGDVRGNYSNPYIFEFDDEDAFYCAAHPFEFFDETEKRHYQVNYFLQDNNLLSLSPVEGEKPSFSRNGCDCCDSLATDIYSCNGYNTKTNEIDTGIEVCYECLCYINNGE